MGADMPGDMSEIMLSNHKANINNVVGGLQQSLTDRGNYSMWQMPQIPSGADWAGLSDTAKQEWDSQMRQYQQTGIWPGSQRVMKSEANPDYAYREEHNLRKNGHWAGSPFVDYRNEDPAWMSMPEQDIDYSRYYRGMAGPTLNWWEWELPDLTKNPKLWEKAFDYDAQAYDQANQWLDSQLINQQPEYQYNIARGKMASAGGR